MAKKKQKNAALKNRLDQDIYFSILAVFLIAFMIIGYRQYGPIGSFMTNLIRFIFGSYYNVVYCLMLIWAIYLLFMRHKDLQLTRYIISAFILYSAFLLWSAIEGAKTLTGFAVAKDYLAHYIDIFQYNGSAYGGIIGALLYSLSSLLVDRSGSYVVIAALVIVGLIFLLDFRKIKEAMTKRHEKPPVAENEFKPSHSAFDFISTEEAPVKKKKSTFIDADVMPAAASELSIAEPVKTTSAATSTANPNYTLPPLNILDNVTNRKSSNINLKAAEQKSKRLLEILHEFGINAELIGNNIGPSVTKIEIKPESNVKISKIAAIQDNLKMELAAKSIRIEAPIPGRNAVGVEIPNVEMTPVRMSELIATIPEELKHKKLLFILGKDLMGRPVYCEMDKMPHLLIAGATGSGKSVCVNGLICTILLRTTPDEVKVLLIDPKKVEFTQYRNIPHLIGPVISDSNDASRALKVIVDYMENRYEVFSKVGVRNINTYNDYLKSHPEEKLKQMPRIVVIIDELADLMSTVGKDVEQSIQRITQLARAAGIHLIVATQRPSTDVITGIIKANIPSRIAFAVSSGIDSRTIIDTVGAERLLGNGDMLYWPIGEPTSIRLQGVYVTDDEVNRIADFTSKQMKPMFDDAFIRLQELDKDPDGLMNDYSADPLFEEVVEYIREAQKASTSLLQRKFGIGYNRAARLIDVLEQRGMIGPAQGSKPREVFLEKVE
ncbi:MAG: DNA translocase FtsK [Erysipelotrichaceae bacterium]|nr:DNA translocase FtsK [Erysipelotrichaceae bacterium]